MRHGFGICKWNNGDVYEGQHQYDYKHGVGIRIKNDGSIYDG